jgi:DNA-binding CsgD family transcriptional regulator
MARLRIRELKAFSRALLDLYSPSPELAFPAVVFSSVRRLLSCDFYCYAEYIGGRNKRRVTLPVTEEPTRFDIFDRYLDQLPSLNSIRKFGINYSVRISDFMSLREWHCTDLYNYLFRPKKLSYQLYFLVRGVCPELGVALNRSSKDFTAEERTILDLFGSHLRGAYRNYQALRADQSETARHGVTVARENGEICYADAQADRFLTKYFGNRTGYLPERLRDWLNGQRSHWSNQIGDCPPFTPPLRLEQGRNRLVIRVDSEPDSNCRRLRFTEEATELSAKPLERLGLTVREAEVLLWVSQGKSNGEIGQILGMKERTACKHLEKIFAKLCVENRTSAANVALEELLSCPATFLR